MGTNSKLYKWAWDWTISVTFVNIKKKTIYICYINVKKNQMFWREVKRWMQKETNTWINFSSSEILLRTPEDTPPLFDLFLITAKMHIYSCKFKGIIPNLDGFIRRVNNIKYIEKYIAVENNKTSLQSKMVYYKWGCWPYLETSTHKLMTCNIKHLYWFI